MKKFTIKRNEFLKKSDITAYHSIDYIKQGEPGNPQFILDLKNEFEDVSDIQLTNAVDEAKIYILKFFKRIKLSNSNLLVCVVPRSKANFKENQLCFKKAVKIAIKDFNSKSKYKLRDGSDLIIRHTNVKTTHRIKSYDDGDKPYPGITIATCTISNNILNQNILLIDDIYTKSVNVIEDCIQALFDNGAKNVLLYCVAKTLRKNKINVVTKYNDEYINLTEDEIKYIVDSNLNIKFYVNCYDRIEKRHINVKDRVFSDCDLALKRANELPQDFDLDRYIINVELWVGTK